MSYDPIQQPQQQIIYQQVVRPPSNGMATTSLVLGIVAIIPGVFVAIPFAGIIFGGLAFLPAVLAVVFGHLGKNASNRIGGIGRGAAVTGMILGYITLGMMILAILISIITLVAAGATQSAIGS